MSRLSKYMDSARSSCCGAAVYLEEGETYFCSKCGDECGVLREE